VIEEESNEKKHKKITIYSHSPMHREKITLGEMNEMSVVWGWPDP
jgi:hypothetical protein